MRNEDFVYQRIGEFIVSFQWLENKLREIGWFILDPERSKWPPVELRNLSNEKLVDKVHGLFLAALPKCGLPHEWEEDLRNLFLSAVQDLHKIRRDRNRILHSAFVELKAGDEVQELLRSNPKIQVDDETGETLFDQEWLTAKSFSSEMKAMTEVAQSLNHAYLQLIARYPHGDI